MTVRLIQNLFPVNVIIRNNINNKKHLTEINPYFQSKFYAKNLF